MQRVVLHTAIAEQIVNELACGEGGRVHGAKCLAVLAGVACFAAGADMHNGAVSHTSSCEKKMCLGIQALSDG